LLILLKILLTIVEEFSAVKVKLDASK